MKCSMAVFEVGGCGNPRTAALENMQRGHRGTVSISRCLWYNLGRGEPQVERDMRADRTGRRSQGASPQVLADLVAVRTLS